MATEDHGRGAAADVREFVLEQARCVVCQTLDQESTQCFNGHVHCAGCELATAMLRKTHRLFC